MDNLGNKMQAAKAIHKAKSFKDSVGKKVADVGKPRPKSDKINYSVLPDEDIENEPKKSSKSNENTAGAADLTPDASV